jgi:2-aminobenzoate-CoA ligase
MSGPYDSFVRDALPPASLQPDFLFDLPQHAYPEQLNAAAELVDRAVAEGDGERIAIRNALGVTSYAELADRSGRIARLLSEREGLVPGNRVLLFGANGAMLFAAWLGILQTGEDRCDFTGAQQRHQRYRDPARLEDAKPSGE